MKYVVKFGAKDGSRFSLLYQAFILGGNNSKAPKDIEKLRREIAVTDLFWSVSDLPPGVEPRAGVRILKDGAQSVTFDRPQYELIQSYLDAFVGITATSSAREIVDLVDWFAKVEPTESAPAPAAKKKAKSA
jgi:hypothetical protein